MKRRAIGHKLAGQLFSAERAIDAAFAEIADLAGALPRARLEADISAIIGQDAVQHVADAMMGAAGVRRSMIAAHKALAQAQDEVGLGSVRMIGGGEKESTDLPRPIGLHVAGGSAA